MRIIAIIIASLLLLLLAACEILVEFPVAWWLYLALTAVFATGLLKRRSPRQQLGRLFALTTICVIMVVIYVVPWGSRSAFLKHLYSIKRGMTANEARRLMTGYMVGTGWPANPLDKSHQSGGELEIEGTIVFRHSNDPAYNSDWGIVHIREGQVTSVEFSPD